MSAKMTRLAAHLPGPAKKAGNNGNGDGDGETYCVVFTRVSVPAQKKQHSLPAFVSHADPQPRMLTNKTSLCHDVDDFDDCGGNDHKRCRGKTPRYKTRRQRRVGLGRAMASLELV
ncbi:MAG: hypothetical protein ABSA74_01200 [Candidatus Staskawiczbacteria bacterium]|jgi:hypothetical protein